MPKRKVEKRCATPTGMCYYLNIVPSLVVTPVLELLYLCCMLLHESFLCIIWRGLYPLCIRSIRVLENLQAFSDLNKLGSSD